MSAVQENSKTLVVFLRIKKLHIKFVCMV